MRFLLLTFAEFNKSTLADFYEDWRGKNVICDFNYLHLLPSLKNYSVHNIIIYAM